MKRAAAATTALGVLLLTMAVRAGQNSAGKPLIPVAASTLADKPETYVGQLVTVTGAGEPTLVPPTSQSLAKWFGSVLAR